MRVTPIRFAHRGQARANQAVTGGTGATPRSPRIVGARTPPTASGGAAAAGHERSPRPRRTAVTAPAAGRPAPRRRPRPCTPDAARQVSRSRLPLPPVPAASRPAARMPGRPAHHGRAASPRCRSPEPRLRRRLPLPRAGIGAPLGPLPPAPRRPSPVRAARGSTPSRRSRPPAPARRRLPLRAAPPRVPRQTGRSATPARPTATGPSPRAPSEPELVGRRAVPARGLRAPAPGTSADPRARLSGRRRQQVAPIRDSIDHEVDAARGRRRTADDLAPAPVRGPASGPVMGGRAAMRAERQAADMARRKAREAHGSRRRRPGRARGRRARRASRAGSSRDCSR